jgi:uncharacterized protein (UPF0333 family)
MQNNNKLKKFINKLTSTQRAQGAIEYLLIIGVAIIIVAVAIIALSGVLTEGTNSVDKNDTTSTKDALKEDLAESMNKYYISNTTINYFTYEGDLTTIGELKDNSKGVDICLGNECDDKTNIEQGNIITVTGQGTILKTDLNKQEFVEQEICDDSIDNDHDTRIDCMDLDCNTKNNCEYKTEQTCNDTIDNDGDGQIDCEDSDCYLEKTCAIFFDDFETGLGEWNIQNDGGDGATWGLYNQSSGYNFGIWGSTSFDSNMLGVGERCAGADCLDWREKSYITSPQIELPQSPLVLEFDSWTNNEGTSSFPEPYFDVEYVEVSSDEGSSWAFLGEQPEEGLQNVYEDATLRHFEMDLIEYAGQRIILRFRYDSGDSCCGPGEGWYVDNIWIHK